MIESSVFYIWINRQVIITSYGVNKGAKKGFLHVDILNKNAINLTCCASCFSPFSIKNAQNLLNIA